MSAIDLNKKQLLVYRVIKQNPGVQNNDADLIAAVWRYEGWRDERGLEQNIMAVTRPETITRRRRELHLMGLIEYSDEADKTREEAFKNERERANPQGAIPWLK
jgi:hypothetical protein